jgi:hypothetical protein
MWCNHGNQTVLHNVTILRLFDERYIQDGSLLLKNIQHYSRVQLTALCRTVKYKPWLPLLHQPKMVCDITMATQQCYINNPNPLLSKAYLTNLNLNHFKMIEAMGLKIIALRSPSMGSPAYQIS